MFISCYAKTNTTFSLFFIQKKQEGKKRVNNVKKTDISKFVYFVWLALALFGYKELKQRFYVKIDNKKTMNRFNFLREEEFKKILYAIKNSFPLNPGVFCLEFKFYIILNYLILFRKFVN